MTALSFFLSGLLAPALAVIPVPLLIAVGGLIVAAGAWPLRGAVRAQAALAAG